MTNMNNRAYAYMYRSYLAPFIGLAYQSLYPGKIYYDNWHIYLLADLLRQCYERRIKRLVINLPPRSLKSMSVSVAFPAWILGHDPTANIMCVAGDRSLAEEQQMLVHDFMNHASYRAIFPHVDVVEKGHELRLAHRGTRKAFTPRESMTGRGADFIIIDDPLPVNMADNDKAHEQINRWYDGSVYQRLDDKENGVIIVVMQRLHVNDLCGHLFRKDGWLCLNLKAIAEEDETYPWLYGNRVVRRKGEALHPALETRDQHRKAMLDMGAQIFMAQYQQDPYPPGQGKGRHGWHSSDELQSLGMGFPDTSSDNSDNYEALVQIPEERYVLRDIFGEVSTPENPIKI